MDARCRRAWSTAPGYAALAVRQRNWRFGSRRWERGPLCVLLAHIAWEGVAEAQRGARRGALPGGMGLPTTMLRQDLRDRRVTSLASLDTVDGSDVSEDETERRLAQTQDIHPALAAAAAAAGLRARDGQVPPQAPQRTDLAGRPLPPPVIASQNGDEDELALGGRATPGVAVDQDFGTGEIDQMLGHWATRRPDAIGLQQRLAEVRAEMPSPERSLSPEAGVHGGETSETVMGARSDDEDLTATSRTSRYGGLYRDAAFGPMARGQTPQPHHRLHQPRSASGFSALAATPRGLDMASRWARPRRCKATDRRWCRRRWPRHPQEGRADTGTARRRTSRTSR